MFTNRGIYQILGQYFRGETKPTNLYIALITADTPPEDITNTFNELTEITAGNGYTTGGIQLNFNDTDWDAWVEQDSFSRAYVQLRDIIWTASSGPIPASGDGARYAVLTDDNGTIANREVYAWFDLVSARSVLDTETITLQDSEIRGLQA